MSAAVRATLAVAVMIALWAAWLLFVGAPPIGPARPYPTIVASLTFIAAAFAFWRADRPVAPTMPAQLALLAVALIALGLPLAGLWAGGRGGENVVFGIWQASDASNYETGALSLLWHGQLDSWNTRRPLMAVALATIFSLSGASLMTAQVAFVLLVALASFIAARAVWRTHGLGAALLVLGTLVVFQSLHIGSFLSEMLGLPLGALAFALLWTGLHDGRRWPVAVGLTLLSLGLNARAGAFFVLPVLVVWLTWRERKHGARAMAVTVGWSLIAVAAGFAPARVLTSLYGVPEGVAFGNLAPTLYGLAVGGKGWLQVYADHPAIKALPNEAAQFAEIYRLALAAFLAEPWRLPLGVLRAYNDYIFNTGWVNFFRNALVRAVAIALLLAGLVDAIRRRHEIGPSFLLVVTIGVLLSVPILADGGARVFAATIPTTAALIALGGAAIARRIGRGLALPTLHRPSLLAETALAILMLALCGPLLELSWRAPAPLAPTQNCPTGLTAAAFLKRPGSHLLLVPDGDARAGHRPFIALSDFQTHTGWIAPVGVNDLPRPIYLVDSFDQVGGRAGRLAIAEEARARGVRLDHLCGAWHDGTFIAAL
jgi:hypothetical protein